MPLNLELIEEPSLHLEPLEDLLPSGKPSVDIPGTTYEPSPVEQFPDTGTGLPAGLSLRQQRSLELGSAMMAAKADQENAPAWYRHIGPEILKSFETTPEQLQQEADSLRQTKRFGQQIGALPAEYNPIPKAPTPASSLTPEPSITGTVTPKAEIPEALVAGAALQNELLRNGGELVSPESLLIMGMTAGAGAIPKFGHTIQRLAAGYFGIEGARGVVEGYREYQEAKTPEEKQKAIAHVLSGAAIAIPAGSHAISPRIAVPGRTEPPIIRDVPPVEKSEVTFPPPVSGDIPQQVERPIEPPPIVTEKATDLNPVRENGARTSIVLPDGTAIVGGRFHGETLQQAIEQGLATEAELVAGKAAFTKPDGTTWDLQGKPIQIKSSKNLSEASAGEKALAVRQAETAGRNERDSPPSGKTGEGARETAIPPTEPPATTEISQSPDATGLGAGAATTPAVEPLKVTAPAANKPAAQRKADAAQFTARLKEYGEQLGFIQKPDDVHGYAGGSSKSGQSGASVKAKVRHDREMAAARRRAITDLGGDPAKPDFAALNAELEKRIAEHEARQAAEAAAAQAAEAGVESELPGDVAPDFLPGDTEREALLRSPAPPQLAPGEKGTGDILKTQTEPEGFKLTGEDVVDQDRIAAEKAQAERDKAEAAKNQMDLLQTSSKSDPFTRAHKGDESAFDDLDAQFREIYPEPEELEFGRQNPNQVHTPQQFAERFNKAFAARDFDTVLDTLKATSDVSIWKPFLKDLFKRQATDPVAAAKAEWFRHVFAGTIPPGAIPRPAPKPAGTYRPPPVTPTPRPKAGTAPPPRPPPSAPAPPPVRIPVEPITGGKPKSPFQIIEDFSSAIGKAIRVLRMKKNVAGVYRPGSTLTAERFAGDLDTAAHELAGHWTDDRYGIGKPWVAPKTRSPYDAELAKFWIHGSVTPRSTLRYRRAEGIAEFIRAYVVNPKQAKLDAPTFSAYFERTLPPEALKAINDFGTDVRTWAGADPLVRAGLNIRMDPPSLTERLWKGLHGRGFGFEINPIDRLRLWFDDPYHYAVKAFHEISALRGGKLKPQENFELLSRLLATHDARMSDQFERGLTPLRPGQAANPKGQLEVERAIDPATKEPMTMKWLLGAFDTAGKEAFTQDMRDASAYMIAQRTVEKGKQLGRDINVSGIGAGILTDKSAAQELLNRVAADPALKTKLDEAARRYRLWADQNLTMLVDAGRISAQQARDIRKNNQQYVDMHRLAEEFETGFAAQRGRNVGTAIGAARDVIKRFKGSTKEVDNVYSNLLEQTDSIQKEAHRNVVMRSFVDGLTQTRELHGPNLKDFDQFGRKVTSADANTIKVFRDGKVEHWQFAPEIYESLKGLGELGVHAFIDLLAQPSRLARYMITHGPQFMLRNPVRDTFERSVTSRNASKPWDILQGYSQAELSRYEVFGGGQFGNYIVDRHVWNRELKKVMRDLTGEHNIFLSPLKLKHAWESLAEKSEKLGRVAEFRRAFDRGKNELGYDDYNSALYAAGEARGLLDFAKAGTVMRSINRLVPFSNARLRGLARATFAARENPTRFVMKWGMFVLAPTIATMLWNRQDKKTWEEYQQLPAYQKDFFWNFKVGPYWLRIPKPHELGVMAGGVERAINKMLGDKHALEGLAGSVASAALPVSNPVEGTGPLKTLLELEFNRDTFRNRDIIPSWERDLKLELRKGKEHASGAGKGIAGALNVTGLTIDPRQVDYVLGSYGGLGQIATGITGKNRGLADTALKTTGFTADPAGTAARDVQWVLDWAKKNGKTNLDEIKNLQALRKAVLEEKDAKQRDIKSAALRKYASQLREALDRPK